jgi:hypothetical protein
VGTDLADSWDRFERFSRESCERWTENPRNAPLDPCGMLGLVQELRARGYDALFRATWSVGRLILTRNRVIQPEESFMTMSFWQSFSVYVKLPQATFEMILPTIQLTPEVEDYLQRLAELPFDEREMTIYELDEICD